MRPRSIGKGRPLLKRRAPAPLKRAHAEPSLLRQRTCADPLERTLRWSRSSPPTAAVLKRSKTLRPKPKRHQILQASPRLPGMVEALDSCLSNSRSIDLSFGNSQRQAGSEAGY
jgi:hypothetical protein